MPRKKINDQAIHDKVSNQYSNWVYPEPVMDMQKAIDKEHYADYGDPSLFYQCIFPTPLDHKDLKILIAGCGANQAAYYALRNPQCEIVAIDISDNSLKHEQYLKDKHKLTNLSLHKCTIEEAPKLLARKFDYIVCSGVLHHLPDCDKGLLCLKEMLAPHGVMSIMLYGKIARSGVYMMQDLFKLSKLEQKQEDVDIVKATLDSLTPTHSAKHYMAGATDLGYDAGIVDTFLHPSDKAFSVNDIMALVKRAGLKFRRWTDKALFNPDIVFAHNHPLLPYIKKLSPEKQWEAIELYTQKYGCHRFMICHQDVDSQSYSARFTGNDFLSYVPHLMPGLEVVKTLADANGGPAEIKRDYVNFTLSAHMAPLLELVNGKLTIEQILDLYPKQYGIEKAALKQMAINFYRTMYEIDCLQYDLKPSKDETITTQPLSIQHKSKAKTTTKSCKKTTTKKTTAKKTTTKKAVTEQS